VKEWRKPSRTITQLECSEITIAAVIQGNFRQREERTCSPNRQFCFRK
jgi:hypothetical protein